jgi:hypothetical protein
MSDTFIFLFLLYFILQKSMHVLHYDIKEALAVFISFQMTQQTHIDKDIRRL